MKKIPVKKKIASLKPSSTLAINEKCKELTASGKKIYKFGFGQSPFPIPQSIVNCLKNNANRKNYLPMQKGDVHSTISDTSLLKRITGYSPKTRYKIGIKKFIKWYKNYY